jgi:dolichyl-phosphate beta-glucosyltransferase
MYAKIQLLKGFILKPKLTLLIPCYNEALRLSSTLSELEIWMDGHSDICSRLMMVNDGSTDETKRLILESRLNIDLVSLDMNLGKGGAIAAGIKKIDTDLVLIMDADLSTSLKDIRTFYEEIVRTDADIVVANRFHPESHVTSSILRKLSSRFFYLIVHGLAKFKTQDTQCGFKLFKAEAARDLFSDLKFLRYSFDLEILFKAESRYHIKEMPVRWLQKDGSRVRLFHDGLQMVWDLLKLK